MNEEFNACPRLRREGGRLRLDGVALDDIARQFGTPVYVYSRAGIEDNWRRINAAFGARDHLVCYAVKACSNIAVLDVLARLGSGFDIVSGGELERVMKAGGDPAKVVFSGVGKQPWEIERALRAGIHCFNVESAAELAQIEQAAGDINRAAPVSVRVNPDVDANTHPYIATGLRDGKFGVGIAEAEALYDEIQRSSLLDARGVDCHIGSQVAEIAPYREALQSTVALADRLVQRGVSIAHLDIGGGFGIAYPDASPPPVEDYIAAVVDAVGKRPYRIITEPGRAVAGSAGLLLTTVLHRKRNGGKDFAVVDAAMNDLLRPALYQARHDIVAVRRRGGEKQAFDVVGPVCETGDTFGQAHLADARRGDLLALLSAGAYGFSMAGNYNSRTRPAEVIVDGDETHLVRLRESIQDLIEGECLLP